MVDVVHIAMFTFIVYILATLKYSSNYIQLNPQPRNENYLDQCLLKTVLMTTKPNDSIAIINSDVTQSYLWNKIVKIGINIEERWTFIQNNFINNEQNDLLNKNSQEVVVNMFLIEIQMADELKTVIENLQAYNLFNPTVNFLITSTTKFKNKTRDLGLIFEHLWHANIYNSLVALPYENDTSGVDLFTWYPYKGMEDFTKFKIIDNCYKGKLQNNKKLYPNKIPDNLKGYAVKVRTVVWPPFVMPPTKRINNTDLHVFKQGFEIVLMNTLAQSMNLNLNYTLSEKSMNWGEIYENGSATGMQAFLLQNEGDIGLSSQGYSQNKLKFFDMAVPYFFEHLVWCVPCADIVPPLTKLVQVFSPKTWILNVSSFALFTLLFWKLSSNNFTNCALSAFGILLGVPIVPIPKRYCVKILLSFWFIFTIHLNMIYKTSLISLLTSPISEEQIKTLDDIFQSDLRLQFMPTMKKYFDENKNNVEELLDRWIDCIDLNDCMDRVAYTRDSVILLPKLYLEFVVDKYKRKHGSYIYCFNGNILTYPGSLLMRKGFPLKNRMNGLIYRMISAGLLERWHKDALSINFSSNKTSKFELDEEKKVIRFKEQEPAFICLIIGLMISIVIFVCEIYCAKYSERFVIAYCN